MNWSTYPKDLIPVLRRLRQANSEKGRGDTLSVPTRSVRRRHGRPPVYNAAVLISLSVSLVVSACGLPSTTFLALPQLPGTSSEGPPTTRRLFFAHNPDNDIDDFEGYDLWYKLYAQTPSGESLLQTDENHIETTPRQPGSGRLQNRGFRRAVSLKRNETGELRRFDDFLPSIELGPTGSSVVFELDLRPPFARPNPPGTASAEITITRSGTGTVIAALRRRNRSATTVTDPLGEDGFYGFWDATRYSRGQHDVYSGLLENSTPDTGPGDLIVVLYVLSVGLDRSQATFSRFYSEPLRLDEAHITFTGSN